MKHLKTLLLILAASLMLVACGSGGGGGSDSGDTGSPGNAGGSDPALLVGAWEVTEAPDGSSVPSGMAGIIITADNKYFFSDPTCTESGTYTATGTTITSIVLSAVNHEVDGCDNASGDVINNGYTVNSTTLTMTFDDGTATLRRL